MICDKCGSQVDGDSAFCTVCGNALARDGSTSKIPKVDAGSAVCPNCGQPVTPGDMFCTGCGSTLGTAAASGASQPSQYGGVCYSCGEQYLVDDEFCTKCGAPLGGRAAANTWQAPAPAQKSSSSSKTVVAVVVIIVVALGIIAALYFGVARGGFAQLFGGESSDDTSAQVEESASSDDSNPGSDSSSATGSGSSISIGTNSGATTQKDDDDASGNTSSLVNPDAVNSSSGYILPKADSRKYTEAELSVLSDYELRLARNEIYARHGRMFNDDELQEYFNSKSWYTPRYSPDSFSEETMFNSYEKYNAYLIKDIENS